MSIDDKIYSDAQLLQSHQKGNKVAGNVLFQRYRVPLQWIKDKQQQSTHVSLDPVSADEMEQGLPQNRFPHP